MSAFFQRIRAAGAGWLGLALLAVLLSLAATWYATSAPWSARVVVGGEDSAYLGQGYYTREVTADGVPFRWTNGPAIFRVPYMRSSYLVSFRADTATGQPYLLKLLDGQRRWASVELQPGFRQYQVLWPAPVAEFGFAGLGGHDFTLLAEARSLGENDNRIYGVALSELAARDLLVGAFPTAPLAVVSLTLGALAWLLRPLRRWRGWLFAGLALALPLLYTALVWRPPDLGNWLPFSWLPWFVASLCVGLAVAHEALRGPRGAWVACGLVVLALLALLASLNAFWQVEGPDYGWHLNHGGSWDRVFRAHRFYPFGFPLVLYLGELAGNPLAWGRAAGLLATVATAVATIGLCWRLYGRAYAWLGGVVLLGAPVVVAYGVLASTDAPMAAFAALALLALCWREQPDWRTALAGGALLGLAYLFRFQAMVLLPAALLWLLFQPMPELPPRLAWLGRTRRLAGPLLALAAFVVCTAPQWLLDIRDFGRPYFNEQYTNIWLFAYGKQDSPPSAPPLAKVWYILSYDPSLLWRHWAGNLQQAATETLHGALVWPFGVLALMGIAVMLASRRDARFLLMLLWIAVYVAAVALTYNKERFFLPVMPALVAFAVGLLVALAGRAAERWQPALWLAGAVAVWCWALLHLLDAQRELIVYALR